MIVARQWTQQVIWSIHEPISLKAGINPEVIKALADGRRPVGMDEDEDILLVRNLFTVADIVKNEMIIILSMTSRKVPRHARGKHM
jgi:hypothetical protein